jgi:1,4-alpha-glucan branching enzyme
LIYQRKGLAADPQAVGAPDEQPDGGDGEQGDAQNGPREPDHVIVALNFTPVPREGYRIGVPSPGPYQEIFNSDAEDFGGSGVANGPGSIIAEPVPWMNLPHSILLRLPPLAGIVLKPGAPSQAE